MTIPFIEPQIAGVVAGGGLVSTALAVSLPAVLTPISIAVAIIVAAVGAYLQIRATSRSKLTELQRQEIEALERRLVTTTEDLRITTGKYEETRAANLVLASQVTNTSTILEVEERLAERIKTVQVVLSEQLERALSAAIKASRVGPDDTVERTHREQ